MRVTGGAGRNCTHERGDGSYRFVAVAGEWGSNSPPPASVGGTMCRTVVSRGRESAAGGTDNDKIQRVDASKVNCHTARNPYGLSNWYAGIQRRSRTRAGNL